MSMIDDAVNLWNVGNESKQEMKDELAALRRKAARWDWVETRMTQGGSPHMDGTFTYRFRSPNGRGRTVGEVIDRQIEKEQGQ